MTQVYFSSWNQQVMDERDKKPDQRVGLQELQLPSQVDNKEIRAFIGWNGIVITDPDLDLVSALRAYYSSVQQHSCGRCIPCRAGTKIIADRLARLIEGGGVKTDLEYLEAIARLVKEGSLCELGISSPTPLLHALQHFRSDFEALLSGQGEHIKEGRPLYQPLLTAPCRNGCPAHIDIPTYLECIKEGDYEEALAVNRKKTPLVGTLGRVCVHPCESNCNRQPYDQSLSIRLLKRFAADFGSRNNYDEKYMKSGIKGDFGRVAIIGAGPAGLNAAYQLLQKGYSVTIFEALPVAGGMLAVGIPSYRLPRDILNAEIDIVLKMGAEIKLNTRVGRDITLDQIRAEGYRAVFIAGGMHESAVMGCEGEDACYHGFMPGVEFLRKINLGEKVDLGSSVAVIGGGNVAMDCARSAVRLGVKEVNLVYRRTKREMPASEAEVRAAEEEGIKFHLLSNPVCILEKSGSVSGMECIQMELGEPDSSGRRRPVPVDGSEFILKSDSVIPAIGQVADFSFLGDKGRFELTKWGTIIVDEDTMATSVEGIFAGGDIVLGARTVIEAIASANRAAEAIDHYLRSGKASVGQAFKMEKCIERFGVYREEAVPEMVGSRIRFEEEVKLVDERVQGFEEAELGFRDPTVAVSEAQRCVKCLRLGMAVL